MPYDGGDLAVKAEFQIDGVWITVTSRARSAGKVRIKHAQSAGSSGPETSRLWVTIGNDDGWLTEDDPRSPWHPHIGRGTPIRMSLTGILPSDAGRFCGEIDKMTAVYPGGDSSAMEIEAIGTWGALAQNDEELRSPLFRTVTSIAPFVYLPLEGDGPTYPSGLVGGAPVTFPAGVVAGHDSSLPGSGPLPKIAPFQGGPVAAVPAYTDTGVWAFFSAGKADTAGFAPLPDAYTVDGAQYMCWVNGTQFAMQIYNPATAALTNTSTTVPDTTGQWWAFQVSSSAATDTITAVLRNTLGETVAQLSMANPNTHNIVNKLNAGGNVEFVIGQYVLVTDPAVDLDEFGAAYAWAAGGWAGETAKQRAERLGREEGLNLTVVGDSTHLMGPQRAAKLTNLLTDCQDVDQGIWSDDRSDIGLIYRTGSHLYTQAAQVAVQRGSLTPDTGPTWDYQGIRNEWTITRVGGSSSIQSDEDHVARVRRRLRGSANINVYADGALADQARWRVTATTPPGPRYASFGINLRNVDGAKLADAVLGMEAGDRLTAAAAAFPDQHPPGGADQMVLGWTEELDADWWEFRPDSVPYRPYLLVGRWAALSHELNAAINSSVTTIDIANTSLSQPMLGTDAAKFGSGYGVTVGAEKMRITAVAPSLITFGSAGTASTGSSGSRTPGMPGSVAAGNLIVVYASTRNFGAGTPDTPTDWVRWPIFPSSANVQAFARVWDGVWSMPTVTFSGGAANEDTIAQSFRLPGKWRDPSNVIIGSAACSNPSAQNVIYPGLSRPTANDAMILFFAWKQDDITSATSPGTEIQEASTTAGNDASQVCAYAIQTAAAAVPAGVFTMSGGGSAISRGAVAAIRCDVQTATVLRGLDGTTAASHAAGDDVVMTDPMRWGLI